MRHDLLEYDRLVNLRVVLKNSMNNITSTNGQYQIQKQIDAVEEEFKMVFEDIKTEFALLMALENEYVGEEQGANDVVNQEQDQSCQPGLTSIFGTSTPINNPSGSIFDGNASLKSSTNTNSGFSFPGFAATSTSNTTTTTTTNTSSTFSFGSKLASANKPVFAMNDRSTSNGTEQRVFAGQDSCIFGTNATIKTNTNEDDEGDGEDDSYEPNVSFKPIVQLSAVEVKTGEEDENVLFCELAKLYPFDVESNQMQRT
ncbi:unnamed protein product [Rotaria sordida]|uniref:RanBD1 domain-containing protein n=1 Tax=Rotaria sordida TaxID=392033 RepID=A0A815SP21_9BILA|nr:unnamed protein product [Rotaria sordida]